MQHKYSLNTENSNICPILMELYCCKLMLKFIAGFVSNGKTGRQPMLCIMNKNTIEYKLCLKL